MSNENAELKKASRIAADLLAKRDRIAAKLDALSVKREQIAAMLEYTP